MTQRDKTPTSGPAGYEPSAAVSQSAEFPAQPLQLGAEQTKKTMPAGQAPRFKMLCVVAHPDDECFAFGGALALAADAGVETYVICLTDGQAATNRGSAGSPEQLGAMRRAEFVASCKILGVTHHELLDYQDAQLEFADFSRAAAKLVERIRRFKPDVVITFGGDGAMNTHADHTMVSAFTTAAYHWAASPKRFAELGPLHVTERLYYVTTSFFFPDRPAPLPAPWTVTLDIRAVQKRKFDAFRAHTSQLPLMEKFQSFFEKHGGVEHYTLVASPYPHAAMQTTGLSAGL
jgi:LmbE family N-acetylglucosaminyl deacetylase